MIKLSSESDRVVVAKLQEYGQGHLLDGWDALTTEEQKSLLRQLRRVDMPFVASLIKEYRQKRRKKKQEKVRQAPPYVALPSSDAERRAAAEARSAGEKALRAGEVAILMAAGGLGSRMGAAEPKGNCVIGPLSGKTLFTYHAEKIRALSNKYRTSLPLFVVTSPPTHDATVETFRANDSFGLGRQNVRFLVQDEFPVIDRRGRFVLAEPGRLAMRPNGHGAALTQLVRDESFNELQVRDIRHVFYFQVDNPLARIADPTFLGQHIESGSDATCKMVIKENPTEKIGVFCLCDGVLGVVEYNELSDEEQRLSAPDGTLAFSAGNVAIHAFSTDFLQRIRDEKLTLPYHAIDKLTSIVDRDGARVVPEKPNTVAFETFIFDALAWSKKTLIVETDRFEEFAPIKYANGTDSVATARRALGRLHARWLMESGARFADGSSGNGGTRTDGPAVEISPLFALDADELRAKISLPMEITSDLYLE